jgi:AAA ATPase domain
LAATSILDEAQSAQAIAARLRRDGRNSVVILGPTASGKTSLAEAAAQRLAPEFAVRRARGERLDRAVEEHPLELRTLQPTRKDMAEVVADVVEETGDLLVEGGVPFGKLANRALNLAVMGGANRRLTETQQRFLARVLTVAPGRRPLLIADDLQYWDPVSLRFLRRLLHGELDAYYGRLRRLGVILVADPQRADETNREHLEAVLQAAGSEPFELAYAPAPAFADVLRRFGLAQPLPVEEVETLRLLTGANLALVKLVVDEMDGLSPERRSAPDTQAYFRAVLAQRLAAAPPAADVDTVLRLLTASGHRIGLDELACALRCNLEEARTRAAAAADTLEFVTFAEDGLRLDHETLQPLITAALGEDGRNAHRVLAGCLARLRPGDYGRRALHLAGAGEPAAADQFRLLERLSGVRQGRYAWSPAGGARGEDPTGAALDEVFAAVAGRDHGAAIERLEALESRAAAPLRWECALLRAKLLTDLNEDAPVQRGLGILEELDEARDQEVELWGRAKELQIVALSNLRRGDEARQLEGVLRQVYHARAAYDPAAMVAINRLRRSAEAIHAPEIAHDRLKSALRFFEPPDAADLPAYPAEYLATLNNLCANELLLGRFESARRRARRLASFDFELVDFVLQRPELVWSNVLLCELYNGGPAPAIADAFAGLAPRSDPAVLDDLLLEINISAAWAAADRPAAAYARLDQAYGRAVASGVASQPYTSHFAAANLATLAWRLGRDSETVRRLDEAMTCLREMTGEHAHPFLVARLEALTPVLRSASSERNLEQLSRVFAGRPRFGESWPFFARPLLATDIQFWSEL